MIVKVTWQQILRDMFKCGCRAKAEWMICADGTYEETWSCTKHLPFMVTDTTQDIHRVQNVGRCCFLVSVPKWLGRILWRTWSEMPGQAQAQEVAEP